MIPNTDMLVLPQKQKHLSPLSNSKKVFPSKRKFRRKGILLKS
jgi:hypothetical protein